jgi:MFS family permease
MATAPSELPYLRRGQAAYVIAVLFLAYMFAYLDRQVIGLLTPALKNSLSLSDVQVSLLHGLAFVSIFVVAGMPLGHLIDHTNRRRIIAIGIAFWSLATVACGLAETFWQLFAARLAVGLGEACLAPAAVSLAADYFRPEHRGRAMGVIQAGTPLGSALSLLIGGAILSLFAPAGTLAAWLPAGVAPWQMVFLVIGAPGLLVALLAWSLREPPRREVRVAGEGPEAGLRALLSASPMIYVLFYATYSCVFIVGYGTSAWGPTILMRIYGASPGQAGAIFAGLLLVSSPVAGIVGGFLSDALSRRRPQDGRMLIPVLLLPAIIATLIGFLTAHSMVATVVWLALALFFTNMTATTSFAALQELAPNRLRGKAVALYLLIGNLVGLGGAPTLIALVTDNVFVDEMKLQTSVGAVALGAAILGFALALLLPRRYRAARALDPALAAARA